MRRKRKKGERHGDKTPTIPITQSEKNKNIA
jgi:hypothetical protein